jgi:hypothetical protein
LFENFSISKSNISGVEAAANALLQYSFMQIYPMALWLHSSIGQKDVMRLQTSCCHIYYIHGKPYFQGKGSPPVVKIEAKPPPPHPTQGGSKKKKILKYRIKSNQINARHWWLVDPALE